MASIKNLPEVDLQVCYSWKQI